MRFYLPPKSDPKAVEECLVRHYAEGRKELLQQSVEWTRVHWYVKGVRNLRGVTQRGVAFEDIAGQLHVLWEKSLVLRQIEIGRIMAMDTRPAVIRPEGISLNGLRDASTSQAVLEQMIQHWSLERIKGIVAHMCVDYGGGAIGVYSPIGLAVSKELCIDMIPYWELMPLPANIAGRYERSGLTRRRWVELDWLREALRPKMRSFPAEDQFEIRESKPGSRLTVAGSPDGGCAEGEAPSDAAGYDTDRPYPRATPKKGKYVLCHESFIDGEQEYTIDRAIVMAGKKLLIDEDYSTDKKKPVGSIHMYGYTPQGSFYDRGLMGRLYRFNERIESLAANQFQNLSDVDWLGHIFMPIDMGVGLDTFKKDRRNKFSTYSPDVNAPQLQPIRFAPQNTGDGGARFLAQAIAMLDQLAAQGELYSGSVPGRLESAKSLGVLMEAQGTQLAPAGESIEHAFVGVYKALQSNAPNQIQGKFELKMQRLDESMLGLKVDQATGSVEVDPGNIPDPLTQVITIRSKAPESKQYQYELLKDLTAGGIISPVEFRITCIRDGLGLPIINRTEWEAYRKAWWENYILYGDGVTPGKLNVTTYNLPGGRQEFVDLHPVHSMAHKELINSIAFEVASDEVKQAILAHQYDYHEMQSGPMPNKLLTFEQMAGMNDRPMPPQVMQEMGVG